MKRPRGVAFQFGGWLGVSIYAACAVLAFAGHACRAQRPLDPVLTANQATSKKKQAKHKQPAPDGPVPSLQIPVAPLGFAPPAIFYLTERFSQASLHFLDEKTLLFTFRVPGLIPRTTPALGQNRLETRQIRAVVLDLPSGVVTAEALWEVHDYSTYLWNLDDGKFLLRDRNLIQIGDASLHLQPFLRFPGNVTFIELDPDNHFLIANTTELPSTAKKEDAPQTGSASAVSPDAAPAQGTPQAASDPGRPNPSRDADANPATGPDARADAANAETRQSEQSLLRVLSMDTRAVLLFTRVNGVAHLPIDGDGYYEALRGNGFNWVITYQGFRGTSKPVGSVRSSCYPALEVLAPRTVLASACGAYGGRTISLVQRSEDEKGSSADAKGLGGDASTKLMPGLWNLQLPETRVWPLVVRASKGRRFAFSTLDVTHPIGPSTPLDRDDIRSQSIDVIDTATGKVALSVNASPVLDDGGNFALSPSGDRFAVLHDGAIQIFDLPAAPAMPGQTMPGQTMSGATIPGLASAGPTSSTPATAKP